MPPEAITGVDTPAARSSVSARLRPAQHALAADIGEHDDGGAGILEACSANSITCNSEVSAQLLHRHAAVPRVDADGDAAGMGRGRPRAPGLRLARRRAAQDHPRDAGREPSLDRGHVSNAAAELHGNGGARQDLARRPRCSRNARRTRRSGRPRAASQTPPPARPAPARRGRRNTPSHRPFRRGAGARRRRPSGRSQDTGLARRGERHGVSPRTPRPGRCPGPRYFELVLEGGAAGHSLQPAELRTFKHQL